MPRFKVNIFYVMATVCSLLLIGYSWFVFLPMFESIPEYSSIRNVVILLTILLLIVSGIQIFLSLRGQETPRE